MHLLIENVTDCVTRTVSKHGIIHSLELFKGRTVKVIAVGELSEIPPEPVSEKPYSDEESDEPKEPEVSESTFEMPNTLKRMRDFVKTT